MEVDDIGILREGDNKIRDRRADVTDHNTADEKSCHIFDPSGHQQNEADGEKGS